MSGIFPTLPAGAVVIRDLDGICLDPPGVANAYCPPAEFTTSCQITALPEDCTARILPGQINALVSELLCLAVTMDPEGNWDCSSVCNVALAFTNWANLVTPTGMATNICSSPAAIAILAECLISDDAPNVLSLGTDLKLKVDINTDGTIITGEGTPGSPITVNLANLISGITTSAALKNQLATGLLSATANNGISISADGLYFNSTLYAPSARNINTQHSLTGGGSLAADRTLNLVGDVAVPVDGQFYGKVGGARGWFTPPGSAGYTFAGAPQSVGVGTSALASGIPADVNQIVVQGIGVSHAGAGSTQFRLRFGTAGGLISAGYVGGADFGDGSESSTTEIRLSFAQNAAYTMYFFYIFNRLGDNKWQGIGTSHSGNADLMWLMSYVDLGAALTQISLGTVNGTYAFDGGSWQVQYRI